MKTKEFIAKVEALGFLVHDGHCYLEVEDTEGKDVVDILKAKRWVYDCEHAAFESLHEVKQTELMEVVSEYVTTQVKDREEEKRYLLGLVVPPLLRTGHAKPSYLVIKCVDGSPDTSYSPMEYEGFQKIFTESEIAQMDITGFQKLEVPEC